MVVKEFDYRELKQLSIRHDLQNMLTKIHEYKGKQELYIATTDGCLKQIVVEKARPHNRA